MKKIFYIISIFSALTLAGCQTEESTEGSVELSPETVKAEFEPGTAETVVESSGSWTMEGNYTWCTPSARSGKSGDKITFTFSENTYGRDRAALYKISCGSSYRNFALLQDSGIIEMNAVLSEVSFKDGEVTLNINVESPDDIVKFVNWGVRYSEDETTLIESGTDFAIGGTPAEGDTEFTVTGLKNDVVYYFAGWLELADGTRMYTEKILNVFVATAFESALNVTDVTAHQAAFAYEMKVPAVVSTGICYSFKGNPTIDDNRIEMAEGTDVSATSSYKFQTYRSGKILAAGTTYYAAAYVKRINGSVSYGPVSTFTTKADPFDGWIKDNNYASDYTHFQSLSEYGPVKNATLGSEQYITESASETQTNFRNYWNTALTSYSSNAKYAALFNELVFLRGADGSNVMQNIVWREGTPGENNPKNANRVGGFAYTWSRDANGILSFESNQYAFVPEDKGAAKSQGMDSDEFANVWDGASNRDELSTIKSYWTEHNFFLDWGETKTFDGQTYTEILLCAEDDTTGIFRYNAACFGTDQYDPSSYGLTWYVITGVGKDKESYSMSSLEEGGYYRLLSWSCSGEKLRVSRNLSTGYPAYVPTGDGKAKLVNSDSELYTVPEANEYANRCVVSFSKAKNVCVAKDIYLRSTYSVIMFPCGDQIDLTGTTISSDWNAYSSYSYYRNHGGYFTPTDKLNEPHIYRFNTTFKENAGGEGFKICLGNSFSNCIVSKVSGANPINTWCDADLILYNSGAEDWKWKPDVNGKYTLELDLSALKLRAVPRD
jgi:hypothetical protein